MNKELNSIKDKNIKNDMISFRCTKKEKEKLIMKAKKNDLKLGDYILQECLNGEDRRTIKFLCELQTLLNRLKDKEIKKEEYIKKTEMLLEKEKWL